MSIPFVLLPFYAFGGFGAGLLSGLLGIGGGTVIVPLLLMVDVSFQQAIPLSLTYILFTSFSGSMINWKHKKILPKAVLIMSLIALLGARLGVLLAMSLETRYLTWGFAAMMLLVLGLFFWRMRFSDDAETEAHVITSKSNYLVWACIGLVAGLFSALFGVGGGFIMVPLLVLFSDIDLKQASGTSLASTFFIALGGLSQHFLKGHLVLALHNHLSIMAVIAFFGLIGAPLGARLNHRLPTRVLRVGFVIYALMVTFYMLYKGGRA